MQSEKGNNPQTLLVAKKDKVPLSRYHFFFTDHHKDYFLFLNTDSGFLVYIKEEKASIIKEFTMEPIEPIKFLSTGSGDIHILHSKGILWQNIEQIITHSINPFRSISFEQEIKPLNFFSINTNSYTVACESQLILIIEDKKIIKTLKYPSNLVMNEIIVDIGRREQFEPRLMIPCKDLKYPLVFSDRQLLKWKNSDYLKETLQTITNYYLNDQCFAEEPILMQFSSTSSRIYAITISQILIFSIKRSGIEEVDYLLGLRMRVNMKWDDFPSFIWANTRTGALLMIGKEKIVERDPANYIKSKLSFKQKSKSGIYCGYNLSASSFGFVFLSKEGNFTRLRFLN